MSVVALPVARISVGPYWLRPACWAPVVFLVGKAETGPDQNHLHPSKFIQNLIKESKLISIDSDQSSFTAAARTGKLLRWAAAKRLSFQ
jgi:hypothetical protein